MSGFSFVRLGGLIRNPTYGLMEQQQFSSHPESAWAERVTERTY